MRELAVHYCPECGFYAFYQLSRNAVCPRCARKMTPLDMRYQDFMDLDCAQRDELLSRKLIEQSPLVSRLMKPHRENNTREIMNLRKKLKDSGATIEIKAVYGFGYKMVVE